MVNFLFHRVHPVPNKMWQPMHPKHFEYCIKTIQKHFHIISFERDFKEIQQIVAHSKKQVATIMFDDGYKDNLDYALPILAKYGLPASFYVVTNVLENGEPIWTYKLDEYIATTKYQSITFDNELIDKQYKHLPLGENCNKSFKPYLKQLSHAKREEILQELFQKIDDVELEDVMMNWNDVNEIKNAGYNIGSHTHTHPQLGQISYENQLNELQHSKSILEKRLQQPITSIAYPNGHFNADTLLAAKKAGYTFGLAVQNKSFNPLHYNTYCIPRVELYQELKLKTWLRIKGIVERITYFKETFQ